ncbi:dihydropteroate synthase [Amylibacter sp. SFDW26]|uniref:dihydropteroate synthase n=1 Tax=Amylibacter sp. SFDW26 TaxID=2652722 RepID=UPI0012619AB5|nr:dihydropteroate synthase [Amylibacter sp. SFDW26]KAB7615525.1 dihydropteroate synthase [Amylibacter sp. SFDW26]
MIYYRPIAQIDRCRPKGARAIAGGWSWFTHAECLERGGISTVVPITEIPVDIVENIARKRDDICGLSMSEPHIMGVLNVTPDSFSDGGQHNTFENAVARAKAMIKEGTSLLDIGGESTRPGADYVDNSEEIARTAPVIEMLKIAGIETPMSIDTRKADVAAAALQAGAVMFNDVTALTYDTDSLPLVGREKPFVCLMHSLSDPKTMQNNPEYDDVLLDIYDHLADQIALCVKNGLPQERIVIDPGIGFGKTMDHNLQLIRGLSLFHGLGCPVLLGVSRKRFIGEIGHAQNAADRAPGSIAIALEGLRQGAQFLRVHDIWQTKQAIRLWKKTL